MHVWVNGPFGIGTSSAADELARARPGRRHFDAEQVGSMLTAGVAAAILDALPTDWGRAAVRSR